MIRIYSFLGFHSFFLFFGHAKNSSSLQFHTILFYSLYIAENLVGFLAAIFKFIRIFWLGEGTKLLYNESPQVGLLLIKIIVQSSSFQQKTQRAWTSSLYAALDPVYEICLNTISQLCSMLRIKISRHSEIFIPCQYIFTVEFYNSAYLHLLSNLIQQIELSCTGQIRFH